MCTDQQRVARVYPVHEISKVCPERDVAKMQQLVQDEVSGRVVTHWRLATGPVVKGPTDKLTT